MWRQRRAFMSGYLAWHVQSVHGTRNEHRLARALSMVTKTPGNKGITIAEDNGERGAPNPSHSADSASAYGKGVAGEAARQQPAWGGEGPSRLHPHGRHVSRGNGCFRRANAKATEIDRHLSSFPLSFLPADLEHCVLNVGCFEAAANARQRRGPCQRALRKAPALIAVADGSPLRPWLSGRGRWRESCPNRHLLGILDPVLMPPAGGLPRWSKSVAATLSSPVSRRGRVGEATFTVYFSRSFTRTALAGILTSRKFSSYSNGTRGSI